MSEVLFLFRILHFQYESEKAFLLIFHLGEDCAGMFQCDELVSWNVIIFYYHFSSACKSSCLPLEGPFSCPIFTILHRTIRDRKVYSGPLERPRVFRVVQQDAVMSKYQPDMMLICMPDSKHFSRCSRVAIIFAGITADSRMVMWISVIVGIIAIVVVIAIGSHTFTVVIRAYSPARLPRTP